MLFSEPDAQDPLHHGTQADPLVAEQPPGQLGVEQAPRAQVHFGETGQVLVGRVQHHLGVADRVPQHRQIRTGHRVDQRRAGPGPA